MDSKTSFIELWSKYWTRMQINEAQWMDAPEYAPTGGAARLESRIPGESPICIHPHSVRLRVPT